MAYLEIRNLSKRFGDFVALDQVNFEIEQSEIRCPAWSIRWG